MRAALSRIYEWTLNGIGLAIGWTLMSWLASILSNFFARLAVR